LGKQRYIGIYQNFVTVDNNKDAYSREDWDEVKLMYEALDSRKIQLKRSFQETTEKIAGLKLKFAPMLH
jgi:hypothetical protein